MASSRYRLSIGAAFTALFFALYYFAESLGRLRGFRDAPTLIPGGDAPFIPELIWAYVSLYPMMWLGLWIFDTKEKVHFAFRVLSLEVCIAAGFFVLIPLSVPSVPVSAEGLSGLMFYYSDRVNLDGNALPSLHVAFAFSTRDLYRRHCSRLATFGFSIWAIVIALSTLFTHQHRLIDVFGGLLLAALVDRYLIQERPYSEAALLQSH